MRPTYNAPGAEARAEAGNAIAAERRTPNSIGSAYNPETVNDRPRIKKYAPILAWSDRVTADKWSDAVVALVREQHPDALDDGDARRAAHALFAPGAKR
jgi:hypothetical protein